MCEDRIPVSETHDPFLKLLPRIRAYADRRFRAHDADAREELTANAVALAFDMYCRLVERGTPELAYATPLAVFACRQVLDGRRLGAPLNVNDVCSRHCQNRHSVQVKPLQQVDIGSGCWREVLVEDRTAGPAEIAATRIDFRSWLNSLNRKQRRVAETLATGESTGRVAELFRLSAGRVSQLRRELHDAWQQFQGESTATAIGR